MAESKYVKFVKPAPIIQSEHKEVTAPMVFQCSRDLFGNILGNGGNFSMGLIYLTQPFLMVKDAHVHEYDQFFCFVGGNPLNINEFDAEVEMYLGQEREKFVITSPTSVYIPAGMVHCPLNFKRINKPVMYMDFPLTSYSDLRPPPIKS